MKVPHKEISKYGVIAPDGKVNDSLYNVKNFVEKPAIDKAPSDLAIIGRYLLTPEIFDILAETKPGRGGEVQLTDAIDTLNKTQRVFAHVFKRKRHDVGNKEGYLETSIEYGLSHPETKDGQRRCWPFSMNEKCVEKYFERIFYEEIKSRDYIFYCNCILCIAWN